ncbi:MAG: hypothetical protein K8R88_06755 [Armatimonadetes bacterium]|nr:hypothetical protein [Armatimonadota bacterium]
MKRTLFAALFLVALVAAPLQAAAQIPSAQGKRADEIMIKMRQIDMLGQLLPALFTKEQLKAILPVVEKGRKDAKGVEANEYKVLVELEKKLDASIKNAVEKGQMPKDDIRKEIRSTYKAFSLIREGLIADNLDAIIAVMDKELNKGQKKAIANSLNPKYFDPNLDTSKWEDDQKIRFWVRVVLLDPTSYELLTKMAAK